MADKPPLRPPAAAPAPPVPALPSWQSTPISTQEAFPVVLIAENPPQVMQTPPPPTTHAVINSAAPSTASTLTASIRRPASTATNPQTPNKRPQPDDLNYHQSPSPTIPQIAIDGDDWHRWFDAWHLVQRQMIDNLWDHAIVFCRIKLNNQPLHSCRGEGLAGCPFCGLNGQTSRWASSFQFMSWC